MTSTEPHPDTDHQPAPLKERYPFVEDEQKRVSTFCRGLLYLSIGVWVFFGFHFFGLAQSAMHEIYAILHFVGAAIAWGLAATWGSIEKQSELQRQIAVLHFEHLGISPLEAEKDTTPEDLNENSG